VSGSRAPRPPSGLDTVGRAAWRRAAAVLVELGEPVELSLEPLAAYARACSTAARLRSGWKRLGHPELAPGSTGQPALHPLLGAIERAERFAFELGQSLGLDPDSRRRMSRRIGAGRPAGAASAADRAAPARRRLRAVG
jgi:phage terminase small subunit